MIEAATYEQFLQIVNRNGFAYRNLIGQDTDWGQKRTLIVGDGSPRYWKSLKGSTGSTYLRVNSGNTDLEFGTLVAGDIPVIGDSSLPSGVLSTLATELATTSGTTKDFVIPNTMTGIEVMLKGVSTNGTTSVLVQLGTGGSPETSGYEGTVNDGDTAAANVNFSAGFADNTGSAAIVRRGSFTLTLENASTNSWMCRFGIGFSNAAGVRMGFGSKSLAGALDLIRLTTGNGTDAFDAGAVNVRYWR